MSTALTSDDEYQRFNLMLVRTGRKSHAPGIRRCRDCAEPWIDDHTGLVHCPECRTGHRRFCHGCKTLITNTEHGDRYCISCQNQHALFTIEETHR